MTHLFMLFLAEDVLFCAFGRIQWNGKTQRLKTLNKYSITGTHLEEAFRKQASQMAGDIPLERRDISLERQRWEGLWQKEDGIP